MDNMRKLTMTLALLLMAFGTAIAAQSQTEPQGNMCHSQMIENCPMRLQDAKVLVSDTATGVAMDITTESGDVGELRRRIEMMAKMHNDSAHRPPMMGSHMIPGNAKYEEIPNGGRLILTPEDPARLEAFRNQVRAHAARIEKGGCAMMHGPIGGNENSTGRGHGIHSGTNGHGSHHPQ
jgi:hypothetical protein